MPPLQALPPTLRVRSSWSWCAAGPGVHCLKSTGKAGWRDGRDLVEALEVSQGKSWKMVGRRAGRFWDEFIREFWSGKNIHGARLVQMKHFFFLRMGPSVCRSNYGEVGWHHPKVSAIFKSLAKDYTSISPRNSQIQWHCWMGFRWGFSRRGAPSVNEACHAQTLHVGWWRAWWMDYIHSSDV